MKPADRPVLILGAGSDIARALAAEFAREGHPVQLAARDPDRLERDRADLALRSEAEVTAHPFDVLETAAFETFLDDLPALPHIVISAVGLMGDQDETAADSDLAARVVASNFTGPALFLEAAARRMAELDADTAVIGISSVAGDRGRAKNYVYGGAKAGFSEYLSGMRQKYVRTRVHVMTVKPGFVRTAMTEGMDLPGALTTTPEALAPRILRALAARRMVYYDLKWWLVMAVIKLVPERIFARMRF